MRLNGVGAVCLIAAVSQLLLPSRALAFRSGEDLPELKTSSAVRWAGDAVVFNFTGNLPSGYQIDGVDDTVRAALDPWNTASCGTITASYAGGISSSPQHGDGVNTISFVFAGWSALSPQEAAATTDVIYEHRAGTGWHIVEADIYVNAQNYTWGQGAWSNDSKDLYTVLQHEIGHALGLLHPCEVGGEGGAPDCSSDVTFAASVMYPAYQLGNHPLSEDDRAGLCFLYDCDPSCSSNTTCQGAACDTTCPGPQCPKTQCGASTTCSAAECRGAPECVSPGDRPLGDPCSDAEECTSGICWEGSCTAEMPAECVAGDDCSSAPAPIGAPCESGSDCSGGECLIGARPHSICTRSCALERECPSGWACTQVEGEQVCAPKFFRPGGGCSVSPRPGSPTPIWLGLPLVAYWQRRRRSSARRITT